MRKWLIFVLLFELLAFPSSAVAESSTKLDTLSIQLRSEYDRPSMLVINKFVLSKDTPLPASVTFRFPKDANLTAVGIENTDGQLYDKSFAGPAQQGDWQTVTINVESYQPHQIEYYEALKRDGNERKFKYQWYGDYYVKQLDLTILIPADSTNVITSPVLQSTATSTDGLLLSGTITKTEMKTMQSFQFDLQYQRTLNELTGPGEDAKVQPVAPVGKDTPGRISITNLPWIIGAFGLALIAIALFSYWRSTQTSEEKPRRRRRSQSEAAAEGEGQAYCHECGTRAYPGDRFCRTCGSRLRIE